MTPMLRYWAEAALGWHPQVGNQEIQDAEYPWYLLRLPRAVVVWAERPAVAQLLHQCKLL